MPIQSGQVLLHKYHIVREAGAGSFARVWLAHEPAFGNRQVAIKEPRADLPPADLEEIQRRFVREKDVCVALAGIRAPNIVDVLAVEPFENKWLMVLAYMPGGDLESLLSLDATGRLLPKRRALPLEQVIAIARDLLEALAAVHAHPLMIVHRDIKPSNVLFDAQGRACVADFGLAQLSSSGRTGLNQAAHPGSLPYMAPEQRDGVAALSYTADVYSLGVVLFEMLTGRRYVAVRPGTPPSALRDETPAWLDALVQRALQEDPYDRYEDGGEMLKALDATRAEPSTTVNPAQVIAPAQPAVDPRLDEVARRAEEAEAAAKRKAGEEAAAQELAREKTFESLMAEGNAALTARDYVSAVEAFSEAIVLAPSHAAGFARRSVSYHANGDYGKAIADDTKAIELEPNNGQYYNSRGISYHANGDYGKAIADHTKAIELEPNNGQFYYSRGISYHANRDYGKAIADHTKAIELEPNNGQFYYSRSITYSAMGRDFEQQRDREAARRLGYQA